MLRIALTPGEPAGIGPELVVRLSQLTLPNVEVIAIADPTLLRDTAESLGLRLQLKTFSSDNPTASGEGQLSVAPIALRQRAIPGQLATDNAHYVLESLQFAADGCLDHTFNALVTGPVHKGVINQAGIAFTGHTEFLAERAQCKQVVMMLACEGLRVSLATTHLPLKDVSSAITKSSLTRTIEILHHDLRVKFGISNPRILICGLNPHAGEGGYMGREEIDVIQPVIDQLKHKYNWDLSNPLPADTLFTPPNLAKADAVLAMYHDQGLPVLKHKGFGSSVNITLGLPFIRTSVDHGTALDLAHNSDGTQADLGSMLAALNTAIEMGQASPTATQSNLNA